MKLVGRIIEDMKHSEIKEETFVYVYNAKEYNIKATKDNNNGKILLEIGVNDNT